MKVFMQNHIQTIAGRYEGKINAWDVVNEAISDKEDEFYRPSIWYRICGEEFIEKAFQYAHEADPNALLFYNDYNEINPVKREKIYTLVQNLKSKGIPIDGVGLQGHWSIYEPTAEVLETTMKRFSQLGVKVQITELETLQIERYKTCFDIFRKYKGVLTAVTFWNISDRNSWLDNFPVRGRKDYPLLFDKNLNPKKAFWPVVQFDQSEEK